MLYNYAPLSGHPGGSISSGRIVQSLVFGPLDYDISDPDRDDADVLVYAAGHKALGLYALWALRNEIVGLVDPGLLPDERQQLRLEDLLGFRRNPAGLGAFARRFGAKALDGHPTPATPFVRVATGASGVGIGAALGVAAAALDWFGSSAPRVHVLEGEGGLTPGRVSEALAFAGTASLRNAIVHVDWNQASIDSDHVTRDDAVPGDYVQWNPMELFYLHDWNVIDAGDGFDLPRLEAAQKAALALDNGQPTAIVYRTRKGWHYGIEGRASHGAGHKLCSKGFFDSLELPADVVTSIPTCDPTNTRCGNGADADRVEHCWWDALLAVRGWIEREREMTSLLGERVISARRRLSAAWRMPRRSAPAVDDVYALAEKSSLPTELELKPGSETTLRGQLGKVLGYLNRFSGGAIFIAAADLLGSTSINEAAKEFEPGFFTAKNRDSRTLSIGGICEDAMSAVLSGISGFGRHIGAGSSYGAFIAPLGHIAARLHAIGNQARGTPYRPMILICGHAGLKTGEDGPTHADPQPLQLLQENFPDASLITLTPWDPQEIWYLTAAAIAKRPSVIAPFVTRPSERVLDREKLGLAPASACVTGVYRLRAARGSSDGTIVLQESGVAYAFVTDTLPRLEREGLDLDVYYIASAELFDTLPREQQQRIFPDKAAQEAIGITGFTLPTMYRWVTSELGRTLTLHPYMHGRYPGSGQGRVVIAEAGLDGESQFRRIVDYVIARRGLLAFA